MTERNPFGQIQIHHESDLYQEGRNELAKNSLARIATGTAIRIIGKQPVDDGLLEVSKELGISDEDRAYYNILPPGTFLRFAGGEINPMDPEIVKPEDEEPLPPAA